MVGRSMGLFGATHLLLLLVVSVSDDDDDDDDDDPNDDDNDDDSISSRANWMALPAYPSTPWTPDE